MKTKLSIAPNVRRTNKMVDSQKWKSVAVSLEIYEELKKMANEEDRSVSRQVAYLIKEAAKRGETPPSSHQAA